MDLRMLVDTPPWDWPEDADEMLLSVLLDERAGEADRLLAAELAGDPVVINDRIADVLLSIALDGKESETLRGTSVISLGPCLEQAYIDEFEDPDDVPISEGTFHRIQETLEALYADADAPELVRRRTLEASARAPQDWQQDAIRIAYSSDDMSWKLTAVFCMRFVRGFDDQILEALESEDEDIQYEAICAAGNWQVQAAWPHVAGLITAKGTDKTLLLAAIEAVAGIRPQEAGVLLTNLLGSPDEDIAEAATDAMVMAEGLSDSDDYDRSLN